MNKHSILLCFFELYHYYFCIFDVECLHSLGLNPLQSDLRHILLLVQRPEERNHTWHLLLPILRLKTSISSVQEKKQNNPNFAN